MPRIHTTANERASVQRSFMSVSPVTTFVYLASQSPRRRELLNQIGIAHRLLLPDIDGDDAEDAEALELAVPGEVPQTYVQRVTQLKLDAAVARMERRGLPNAPILCADTTVALDGAVLGKPHDAADAHAMLARLSGRKHSVFTAVALAHAGRRWAALSQSEVQFAVMTNQDIAGYVDTGEPFGKAGAYGIQGKAARFIAHIAGSYSGIMGLPLFETSELLRQAGTKAD
jgi:septum formation protein